MMIKQSQAISIGAGVVALLCAAPASTMPRLMDLYNAHPRAVTQNKDKCTICHVNANGAGALTSFGERYERVGLEFTAALMKEYPNLFSAGPGAAAASGPAVAKPAVSSASATSVADAAPAAAAMAAPAPAAPAAEWSAPRYYREECTKCHGKYADGDPLQGVPAFANRKWLLERMSKTDELMTILMKGKDKMVGQEGKISDEQARELLEYVKSIAVQYGS